MGVRARAILVVVVSVTFAIADRCRAAAACVGGAGPTRCACLCCSAGVSFAAYVAAPIKVIGSATAQRVRCYNGDGLAAKCDSLTFFLPLVASDC